MEPDDFRGTSIQRFSKSDFKDSEEVLEFKERWGIWYFSSEELESEEFIGKPILSRILFGFSSTSWEGKRAISSW